MTACKLREARRRDHNRDLARRLRADSTEAEKRLWFHLRRRQLDGYRFRRQQPIGPYVADFCCLEAKLVVEVDGGQHNEPNAADRDARRTDWLESRGYSVVRFGNADVMNEIGGVLEGIRLALATPHPDPPPRGGRRDVSKERRSP